ncbi:tail fiber protein [Pseudorhodoferax sp. Leaf274]|uniref:tail fiber protein n=1 Tax=Pseudorhodoferax sp. Leaf274 TaxID=1736318 RepID=UPI0007032DA8|nr:tail fiber protein [Pseudorhodoferax sp. Leaf274]KQP43905.1 hypothetical protein ASF44_28675 [Pseudorhodoferax sp. Leaf274]
MTDIVTPPTIAAMPPAPQLTDTQADFNSKAFATVGAFPAFITQTNQSAAATRQNAVAAEERATGAQGSAAAAVTARDVALAARDQAAAAAQSAINAPATRATSATNEAISAGQKWFATQPGKSWIGGEAVVVASQTDPVGKRLYGIVNDYNGSTGLLGVVVPPGGFRGSGTNAGWNISVTGSHDGVVLLGAGPGQGTQLLSIGWGAGAEGIVRPLVSVDGGHWGGLAGDWEVQEAAPPGKRGEFYMNAPPPGWLKANGAPVSRTTHARLFARIGTFYGAGDGSTTFNLPNDNGLFARGWDEFGTYDPARAFGSLQAPANMSHSHGGSTGVAGGHTHSGTADLAGSHAHTGTALNAGAHTHGVPQNRVAGGGGPASALKSEDTAGVDISTGVGGDHGHALSIAAAAAHQHALSINGVSDHAHVIAAEGAGESRPWNRAVLVCIKY